MITGLGHPAFAVRNVDETIGFYGRLGIEEAFRLHNDDGSLMLVYLHVSGDRFIECFRENLHPTLTGLRASCTSVSKQMTCMLPSSTCGRTTHL